MNNSELLQAIVVCNKSVHGCDSESPRYEPLMNHLKALLAEQLLRATQHNFNSEDNNANFSKIEHETKLRPAKAGD